ncbi:MAG TPA: hypothetical protein VGW38_04710 [Chloroflexota bacterium]|nr:hypothetical protein [Chloroflexota bacterium]
MGLSTLGSSVACGRTPVQTTGGAAAPGDTAAIAPQQYGGRYLGGAATGDTQAGASFAQWVLEQDPRRQYYTEAVVRGEQTLGVKVQPTVSKADVQQLLTALAQGMAKTFPGKQLQVIAFYQSGDKLAEAEYSPRTGRVDVRFAR